MTCFTCGSCSKKLEPTSLCDRDGEIYCKSMLRIIRYQLAQRLLYGHPPKFLEKQYELKSESFCQTITVYELKLLLHHIEMLN